MKLNIEREGVTITAEGEGVTPELMERLAAASTNQSNRTLTARISGSDLLVAIERRENSRLALGAI